MKPINARQFKFSSESFILWLTGAACGILVTMSLALGTGRLDLTSTHHTAPAVIVQQAPLAIGEGAMPPPIDEMQNYRVFQPATLQRAELVPPVDEIAQYRRAEAAARTAAETAPPMAKTFETKY